MPQTDAEQEIEKLENNQLTVDSTQVVAESIDVGEVLREFRSAKTGDEQSDFGFDLPVERIAPSECTPIAVSACPVCENTTALPRFQLIGTDYRLVACSECGLGMLHPQPGPAELTAFYPPAYYGAPGSKFTSIVESAVRCAASYRVRQLLRDTPPGGRVLDVGCGRGVALATVADRGFEAHGFEISKTAATGIDPRVQLHLGNQLSEAALPDGHFDLVIIWHVLEHLPNPKPTLEEIQRILKPGGRVAIAVPNIESWQAKLFGPAWFHLDLPRHLFHFSPQTLRRVITDVGLGVLGEQHFSIRQNPFGWVQSALNIVSPRHRNELYSLLKRGQASIDRPKNVLRRVLNKAAYWTGMPVAVALSLLAAACKSGGTFCVTARKPASR